MASPVNIAAIDAGSNAIRIVIARAYSPVEIKKLRTERFAVRLGHQVFTSRRFEEDTMLQAVEAFQHFRKLFDTFEVEKYRAVATAAAREARNRRILIDWIYGEAGIFLEVIDDAEEARLVRTAVQATLGEALFPQIIFDLGGGSLEISFMQENAVENKVALPIGTVRLMEMLGIVGAIKRKQMERLKSHLLSLFGNALGKRKISQALAVACGGNAEALSVLAPGPQVAGVRTLDLGLLQRRLREILPLDIEERMRAFELRKDRAEVIGIAAIVFATLGEWLGLDVLLVPGVGVREGILRDLVVEHFKKEISVDEEAEKRLLTGARQFAIRLAADIPHAEQVSRLAVALFDQLRSVHSLGGRARIALAIAGLVHDVGHFVNKKYHHKHGEYLIRNSTLAGYDQRLQDFIACLVLYHRKLNPDRDHELYVSFDPSERREIRQLSGLLRLAEGLDREHKQNVLGLRAELEDHKVAFRIQLKGTSEAPVLEAKERAKLFEKEFGLKATFWKE